MRFLSMMLVALLLAINTQAQDFRCPTGNAFGDAEGLNYRLDLACQPMLLDTIEIEPGAVIRVTIDLSGHQQITGLQYSRFAIHLAMARAHLKLAGAALDEDIADSGGVIQSIPVSASGDAYTFTIENAGFRSAIFDLSVRPLELERAAATVPLPAPTATQAALSASDQLLNAMLEVDGVVAVDMVNVMDEIVYAELRVAPGYNTTETADALRQVTYATLVSASLEFSVILNDGASATDYMWSNRDDDWQITPLTLQSGRPDPESLAVQSPFGCNGIDDLNCPDFRAIGQNANAHLAQCGDEDKLDRDGDGRACEL